MQNQYSLRKEDGTYLISLIGQQGEKDLNQPPLNIEERLEVRIKQASKSCGLPTEQLRQSIESGITIYWN